MARLKIGPFTSALTAVLAVAVAQGATAVADKTHAPQARFKAAANYVEVTAIVADRHGAFVPGLTLDDFELLEDGKPQRIERIESVIVDDTPAEPLFGEDSISIAPPDSATNRGEGRAYVIAIDHFHLAPKQMPRVHAAIRRFIEHYVQPNDLVSIAHISTTPRASVFTSHKGVLLRVAGLVDPGAGSTASSDDPALKAFSKGTLLASALPTGPADRMERSFTALGRLAEHFGGLRGRRKVLLLFSQGASIEPLRAAAGGLVLDRDQSDRLGRAMREFIARVHRADVNVYGIDATGLATASAMVPESSQLTGWNSLRVLSSETGGEAVVGYNRFDVPYARLVSDASRYYVLGYHTTVPGNDDGFHEITVRVKDRPVTVRARRGFYGPRAISSRNSYPEWRGSDIDVLLVRPLPAGTGGLRLTASASAIGRTATGVKVQLTVELDGADLMAGLNDELLPDNEITLGYLARDIVGESSARKADHLVFRVSPEHRDAIAANGWRYVTTVELRPGYHQLRVAATEARAGRFGSVSLELDVPDLASTPLGMGTILLSTASASTMPTAGHLEVQRSTFPAPPVASRDFARSDTLRAYVAIGAQPENNPIGINVGSTIRDASGREVWRASRKYLTADMALGLLDHVVDVPLAKLAPGPYLLTIESTPAAAKRSVARRVVFSVR